MLFSPALWYLDWPNPEIFSYSLIVVSIAFFSSKKFSLAVFFAAFSSIQNPPVIILMAFFLIYGVADVMRSKQWVKAGVLALATLPAFAPMVFYYINYGTPNLIYKVGSASFSLISFQRTTSFFFDLNQGMMLYIPGIFILFTFLLFRNWRRKDWLAYEIAVVLLLMALMAETTTNWNSDAEGIMRYAVWMLPLLIWGVVEGYELTRKADRIMLGAVLLTQLIIVFTFPIWFIAKKENLSDPPIYVKNNYLAAYLLDSHPSLYNPVPEIFTERTLNKEVDSSRADILPVIYFRTDGTVTKILTDYAGLEGLSSHGDVDAAFLQREKDSHRGDTGVFYIDLSPGEMQFVAQDKPLTVFNAEFKVNSQPVAMVVDTVYRISVTVKNTGTETWYARGIDPINLTYQLLDKESKPVRLDNARDMIPHRLRPGEEVTMPVYLSTPEQPGIYLVDFDMVQENVSWFEPQGNKTKTIRIDVR
ncbi:MAG: hypothetical protein Q7K29_03395 [Thermoleophilia bacterium]|nr:hypothetical protein [Thermoleophilia bacterium]